MCGEVHERSFCCEPSFDGTSVNEEEGQNRTLKDLLDKIKYKRDFMLCAVLSTESGAQSKYLEPAFDEKHSKKQTDGKKNVITLDQCLNAYSREELLTGADQWRCSKCKDDRDIMKKLELFKRPKILIIQLKRF